LRRVAPAQTLPRGESGPEAGDGSAAQTCSSVHPAETNIGFGEVLCFPKTEYWDQLPSLSSELKREDATARLLRRGFLMGFSRGIPCSAYTERYIGGVTAQVLFAGARISGRVSGERHGSAKLSNRQQRLTGDQIARRKRDRQHSDNRGSVEKSGLWWHLAAYCATSEHECAPPSMPLRRRMASGIPPPESLPTTATSGQFNPWLIAVIVALAAFMEILDTSIANVALPHIAGDLGASNDESTWVLTSYLVSNAIILPISGWLAVTLGRKRFFLLCILMFTLTSLLCGIAPSLGSLVFFA
jgi:hypothetical protein